MNETAALFRTLSLGVYVVGVARGGRRNAFTAAWLTQVSFDPLLVALSVNPGHASYPLLREGQGFTVSVLGRDQLELARRFGTRSGRDEDKLAGIDWRSGRWGSPILTDAIAYLDCERVGGMRAGDHELVLGRVAGGGLLAAGTEPLTYAETDDLDGSGALYPEHL